MSPTRRFLAGYIGALVMFLSLLGLLGLRTGEWGFLSSVAAPVLLVLTAMVVGAIVLQRRFSWTIEAGFLFTAGSVSFVLPLFPAPMDLGLRLGLLSIPIGLTVMGMLLRHWKPQAAPG